MVASKKTNVFNRVALGAKGGKPRIITVFERMNLMKINEYDHVRVVASGETGIVVDIRTTNNTYFTVERDGDNKLLDCTESEIEKIAD